MSDVVISVENLSKRYVVGHQGPRERYHSLRDTVVRHGKSLARKTLDMARGRQIVQGDTVEDFWALKDVSFQVKRGEVMGIIGRNGAGKSTLLKILSRITEPTSGRVELDGRVASLLEVGTGFHAELTGRENIFLNGAILGMSRREIRQKFDEIVAFAEVDKFLDTPVKRYSSGMYVRLAFAVAAHLEPEILIVDEVLAVGDAEFQKKCLGKMESVAHREGRTVMFVSHNMAAVEALCESAMLLSGGRLVACGKTTQVVEAFLSQANRGAAIPLKERRDRQGSGAIRFTSVNLLNEGGREIETFQCGASATLALEFENTSQRELRNFNVALGVDNALGQRVLVLDSGLVGKNLLKLMPGSGVVQILMRKICLMPGRYHFTIHSSINGIVADWIKHAASFDVEGGDYFGNGQLPAHGEALFLMEHDIRWEQLTLANKSSSFNQPHAQPN